MNIHGGLTWESPPVDQLDNGKEVFPVGRSSHSEMLHTNFDRLSDTVNVAHIRHEQDNR
jgi:hypothetical protein